MSSTAARRQQSTGGGDNGLGFDLDDMIEKQLKQDASRKEYQQRPEVMEKRKAYQETQTRNRKIARAAMKGEKSVLTTLGLSEEQADQAIATASRVAVPA